MNTSSPPPQDQPKPFAPPRCFLPPRVVLVDEHLIVVDKASGLLSVPGRDINNRDCVVSRLEKDHGQILVVHRLDFDTSGLLLLARNAKAQSELSKQFQNRSVEKVYEAMVWGLVEKDEGEINLPLALDWPNRPLHKVDYETGKASLTHYRVLARDAEKNRTRVGLFPVTGRSHQLRVHLQAIGHPILGCPLYGNGKDGDASSQTVADRLLLHAKMLEFTHPVSGERIHLEAPVPF
ncbi:MAG: RluA family pseudouridine synthase [Spongiibacteraceae bacterium]